LIARTIELLSGKRIETASAEDLVGILKWRALFEGRVQLIIAKVQRLLIMED